MLPMWSNKASKKTRKMAEETAPATDSAAIEISANPPAPRSSKSKNENTDSTSAKRHRKAANSVQQSESEAKPAVAEKSFAAVAGSPSSIETSAIVDPVGVVVPATASPISERSSLETISPVEITHDQIALLAHSYWVARGYQYGSPEEDWQRAERELQARR